jgi:integrase
MPGRRLKGEGSIYQRKSDGRWIGAVTVGYTAEGTQHRKTVSGKTAEEARQRLRTVSKQLDQGLPPPDDKMTVAQLLDRWLEDVYRHKVKAGAYSNAEWAIRLHLNPAIGKKTVSKLTPHDVDRFMSQKLDEGLSTSAVLRMRSFLKLGLEQGVRWGVIPRNVASLSSGPRMQTKQGRALSPEQARSFLASVKGDRLEALYVVMLSLGLRRGEALGLKWSDIDAKGGVLTINRALKEEHGKLVLGSVKTAKSRRPLNMPAPTSKALKAHRARQSTERLQAGENWSDSGLIFTTEIGTAIDPHNFNRSFKKACESAGLGPTAELVQKFLDSPNGCSLDALYLLAFILDIRQDELLAISWSDIDTKRHTLEVKRTLKRAQNGHSRSDVESAKARRTLELPDRAVKALSTQRRRQAAQRKAAGRSWRESGLVFTTEAGRPMDPAKFSRDFRKVRDDAGLSPWHPHELRHSAASLMLEAGIAIEVVSTSLGHSSIRLTADTYGHIREPQRQKAADAMEKTLWGPTGVNA